jgi:Flp pilus assembly pilin Flp
MNPSSPQPQRPVSILDYAVFLTLVAIVVVIILLTQGSVIHDTFTNIARAWDQT